MKKYINISPESSTSSDRSHQVKVNLDELKSGGSFLQSNLEDFSYQFDKWVGQYLETLSVVDSSKQEEYSEFFLAIQQDIEAMKEDLVVLTEDLDDMYD